MTHFLTAGPDDAPTTLMLAPGAGASMSSAWMNRMSDLLAEGGMRVVRFDFAYMRSRQETGSRRPPPKAEKLVDEYLAAVSDLRCKGRLLIGGKSMGGRVASLAAQTLFDQGHIAGLVCLGYPFHPPEKPDQLRTAHLTGLTCPTLIVQGERDPFGVRSEVEGYGLSRSIAVHWVADGDHDLVPRRSSGASTKTNMADAVNEIVRFAHGLP
jgi:predicted alpha/beta-hydrolase family hydrolase